MIFALMIGTLSLVLINYKISGGDYFYPPVIFAFMFFISSLICAFNLKKYDITITAATVLIILIAILIFTLVGIYFRSISPKKATIPLKVYPIEIGTIYYIILVAIQIISIIFFIKYLHNLAAAYIGAGYQLNGPANLSGLIGLYDNLTKFWPDIYNSLAVKTPIMYSLTNPISAAGEYLCIYIAVNNFFAKVSINKFTYVVVFLAVVRVLLNGSRTPIFRIITFIVFLIFYFSVKCGKFKFGNKKFLLKTIGVLILAIILFYFLQFVIGRKVENISFGNSFFTYAGAPLLNINNFLMHQNISFFEGINNTNLIGAHVFSNLYSYIGKLLKIPINNPSILIFTYSNNGIETGNVYTMFYPIIYDFGYFGILIFLTVEAGYYCYFYNKNNSSPLKNGISISVFIYAYLFNDLIMSTFSNRFYSTVLDAPFIKMVIVTWIMTKFINMIKKKY